MYSRIGWPFSVAVNVTVWLGFVEPAAAQPPVSADQALTLEIRLSASVQPPDIVLNRPFDVVLTNHSDDVIRIWNPRLRRGYRQVTFRFVDSATGSSQIVAKRPIDDDDAYWKWPKDRVDPEPELIEIPAGESHFMTVNFAAFYSDDYDWNNLPSPNSGTPFEVSAI